MQGFFRSLWEGLGEGAKHYADGPSPQPSPRGRKRISRKEHQLWAKVISVRGAVRSIAELSGVDDPDKTRARLSRSSRRSRARRRRPHGKKLLLPGNRVSRFVRDAHRSIRVPTTRGPAQPDA